MKTGEVTKWQHTFGFIRCDDDGKSYFVHHTGILGRGFRALEPGQRVTFAVEDRERGAMAVDVNVIKAAEQCA